MTRTMTTSKGQTFQTNLTDDEALEALRQIAGSNNFAFSLIDQHYNRRRALSPVQMVWVHKLAVDATSRAAAPALSDVVAENFAPVYRIMEHAAARLRFPKINFALASGPMRIAMAGPNSRYAGKVLVTDGGKYPNNQFYGSIASDGAFAPSRNCPAWVIDALRELAANPAGFSAEYGRRTGNCCFCMKQLTDARSVSVGYGPICAGHYNLPWG